MSGPRLTRAGAVVQYCGHDGTFAADLFEVAGAVVVRAAGPVTPDNLTRPAVGATHHLVDFPSPGYWNPRLGVFVVPAAQLTLTEAE